MCIIIMMIMDYDDEHDNDINEDNIIDDVFNSHSLTALGLNVTIKVNYNPPADFPLPSPPYFHPATSVILTCHVEEANGSVSYQWSSTGPNSFVVNSTTSAVSKTITRQNVEYPSLFY